MKRAICAMVVCAGCAASALATPSTGEIFTYADQDQFGDAATLGAGFVATVQGTGIRGGTSGTRFFNVQGNNDAFASWGAIRFNLADLYAALDADAAANDMPGWEVQSVKIVAEQSNAAFSIPGALEAWYVGDDATNIDPATAAGTLGIGNVLGGNRMYDGSLGPAMLAGTFNFTGGPGLPNGVMDMGDVSIPAVLTELNSRDAFLTMVIDTDDLNVQATFKGQDSPFAGVDAPALAVSYKLVPTPGAVALLGVAGAFGLRRRRGR